MDFNRSVVVSILPFKLSAAPFHSRSLGEIVDLHIHTSHPREREAIAYLGNLLI